VIPLAAIFTAILLIATVPASSAAISGAAAAAVDPSRPSELRPAPSSESIQRLDEELARQQKRLSNTEESRSTLDQTLRELDLRFASAEAVHESELSNLRQLVAVVALILAVTLASLIAAWRKVAQLEERWRPPATHADTRQLLEELYGQPTKERPPTTRAEGATTGRRLEVRR
jgi:hypothetical protein